MNTNDRFWMKVNKTEGCWLWIGKSLQSGGYGYFHANGKGTLAHRFSFSLTNNLDDDSILHHTCKERLCVNPTHLKVISRKQHIGIHHIGRRVANCVNGHKLTPENIYISNPADGRQRRHCKECTLMRSKERYEKKKEAKP